MNFIKTLYTIVFVSIAGLAFGQQRPQYSQYMNNPYLLNPAVAVTNELIDVRAGFRQQWAGLEDAPRTFYLSGQMSLGEQSGKLGRGNIISGKTGHAIGFIAMKDQTGPLSWTSFYVSYAFKMQISQDFMVSFGASGGFQQFLLDGSRLHYADNSQSGIGTINNTRPDANLGVWIYSKKLFFGASVQQIIPGKIDGYASSTASNRLNQLAKHYFLTGGYHIDMGNKFAIIPSLMFKFISPSPVSFDVNCKVVYLKKIWAGVSYRHEDGISGMVGLTLKEMITLGYSYDYITSDISAFQSGSHEVVLGIKIKGKGRPSFPTDF